MEKDERRIKALEIKKEIYFAYLKSFLASIMLIVSASVGLIYREGAKAISVIIVGFSFVILFSIIIFAITSILFRISKQIEGE